MATRLLLLQYVAYKQTLHICKFCARVPQMRFVFPGLGLVFAICSMLIVLQQTKVLSGLNVGDQPLTALVTNVPYLLWVVVVLILALGLWGVARRF